MNITLYMVGETMREASHTFLFDSYESAKSYAMDNPGTSIFSVSATVDIMTAELVERG